MCLSTLPFVSISICPKFSQRAFSCFPFRRWRGTTPPPTSCRLCFKKLLCKSVLKALESLRRCLHQFPFLLCPLFCLLLLYKKLFQTSRFQTIILFCLCICGSEIQEAGGQAALTWSLSCSCIQMLARLQPSKSSMGLVVRDGALTWLKVCASHQLGTH